MRSLMTAGIIRRFLQWVWAPLMSSCSWGRRGCVPAAGVWHQVQVCSNQFDNRCGHTSRSRRRRRKRRWKWGLVWVAPPTAAAAGADSPPLSRVAWAATAMQAGFPPRPKYHYCQYVWKTTLEKNHSGKPLWKRPSLSLE